MSVNLMPESNAVLRRRVEIDFEAARILQQLGACRKVIESGFTLTSEVEKYLDNPKLSKEQVIWLQAFIDRIIRKIERAQRVNKKLGERSTMLLEEIRYLDSMSPEEMTNQLSAQPMSDREKTLEGIMNFTRNAAPYVAVAAIIYGFVKYTGIGGIATGGAMKGGPFGSILKRNEEEREMRRKIELRRKIEGR
ncbi:hypothetical protein [Botrimarina hoheduenensis]|uniref:Uncharacterized protein n=1 Tax=Botrimarina hoheduenensis TaxID=2528000 RepID=A0A5C5VQA3_9BACT|nr:hypothetical protein [Botrimarina hoheduenensis]TWT40223.1 hypothetical protein Pla111_33540 [Botrimarina hoheduenensis]